MAYPQSKIDDATMVNVNGKSYAKDYANNIANQEEMRLQNIQGNDKVVNDIKGNAWNNTTGDQINFAPQPTAYNSTVDINSMKQYQMQQNAAGLDKARNTSLANLSAEREKIAPTYYNNRAKTSTASQLGAKSLAEFMANRGQSSSGMAAQSELNRNMQLQGDIGNLNIQEQGAFNDNSRRVTDTNNAYNSDLASSNAGIEASAMQQLIQARQMEEAQRISQMNADRGFDYQVSRDTVGDNRYATETAYNQGRDNVQDTGMLANGQFTQQGQANNMSMQIQQAQLDEMQNPNSTTNQLAKLGLQTAQLNFAALPQQLKSQAQQIAQQLQQGTIDMKTAQIKLDYLPRMMQAELSQTQAQISATNRSNQGGSGGGGGGGANGEYTKAEIGDQAWSTFISEFNNGNGEEWLNKNSDRIIKNAGSAVYLKMIAQLKTLPVSKKTQTIQYNDSRKQQTLDYNRQPM